MQLFLDLIIESSFLEPRGLEGGPDENAYGQQFNRLNRQFRSRFQNISAA